LVASLNIRIKELEGKEIDFTYSYLFVAGYSADESDATFANPSAESTNPQLFYIGRFWVLAFEENLAVSSNIGTLPKELIDLKFANPAKEPLVAMLGKG